MHKSNPNCSKVRLPSIKDNGKFLTSGISRIRPRSIKKGKNSIHRKVGKLHCTLRYPFKTGNHVDATQGKQTRDASSATYLLYTGTTLEGSTARRNFFGLWVLNIKDVSASVNSAVFTRFSRPVCELLSRLALLGHLANFTVVSANHHRALQQSFKEKWTIHCGRPLRLLPPLSPHQPSTPPTEAHRSFVAFPLYPTLVNPVLSPFLVSRLLSIYSRVSRRRVE